MIIIKEMRIFFDLLFNQIPWKIKYFLISKLIKIFLLPNFDILLNLTKNNAYLLDINI